MGKFFSFYGLAQRSEYWAVMLILVVSGFFLGFGVGGLLLSDNTIILGLILLLVLTVISGWVILATTARRCRDAGISPYWCLALLVPYVSPVATVVFGIIPTNTTQHTQDFE